MALLRPKHWFFFGVLLSVAGLFLVSYVVAAEDGGQFSETGGLLTVPLFDVGRLWVRAIVDQASRMTSVLFSVPDFSSPWTYVIGVVGAIALYYLCELLFAPMERVKLLGDVGYIAEGKMSLKDTVDAVKRRRAVGDIPPLYPNGWFCILESRDLRVKDVKNVMALGKQLAVFRAENGTAYAIDAYCPHMGANMAAGGLVKGSCLECPFHGWLFRGDDGKCTHIPYCERKHIPDIAKVKSYTVIERNGFILLWHHSEDIEPTWEPPELDEVKTGEWTYRGRSEHHVNAHIEEIPENGADVAHLFQVHGPTIAAGTDLRYMYSKWWSFTRHDWSGEWKQDPDEKHVGILTLVHHLKIFGWTCPILDLKVTARQTGPGIVNLIFESPIFGRGAFLQVLTPTEPLMLRMVHHVYGNRWLPTIIAKFFLYAEALQVERDLMIWNNKQYLSKPLFVKSNEDSLIARHRRWYSQFYSPRKQEQSTATTAATTAESLDW